MQNKHTEFVLLTGWFVREENFLMSLIDISDTMIRQLNINGHATVRDAIFLEYEDWDKDEDLILEFEDSDEDEDYRSLERLFAKKYNCVHHTDGMPKTSQVGLRNGIQERLQILQATVSNVFTPRLPRGRGLARLRDQAWRECGSLAERLRGLWDTARRYLAGWQASLAHRISQWRRFAMTQQGLWRVWLVGLPAWWRRSIFLQWTRLHLFLLEQLTAVGGGSQPSLWTWARLVLALLRMFCGGCYSRLALSCLSLRARSWQWMGCGGQHSSPDSLVRQGLSRQEELTGYLQDLCSADKDCLPVQEDTVGITFLWEEPQGRALVVALLFAFAMLSEIVSASCLPSWCTSSSKCVSHIGLSDLMASATLSHSVVMSLKGAAAVI